MPTTKERNITKEIPYISVPLLPKVKNEPKKDVTTRIVVDFSDQKEPSTRFYIRVGTPKYPITKPVENQVNIAIACLAGVWKRREREFLAREKREGRARGEGGKRLQEDHCIFRFKQANVKILIGQSSKHVNHNLNTLIRLVEINITLLSINLIDLSAAFSNHLKICC